MKTYIWADTSYIAQDFFVVTADSLESARLKVEEKIEELEKAFNEQNTREDQASYRQLMKTKFKGWIMYINKQLPEVLEVDEAGIFHHSN